MKLYEISQQYLDALESLSSADDIPPEAVARLESANDPAAEGVALAAEQLAVIAAIPGLSGVTLVTPGDPALIPAAIRAAGLRS